MASRPASTRPASASASRRAINPAMRFLGPARKELGVPTTFNFLGPLINPARVRRQVIGVSDTAMAQTMLGTLGELGADHAMVFYGDDGLDELTTTTTSTVHELVGTASPHVPHRSDRVRHRPRRCRQRSRAAMRRPMPMHVRSVLAGDKGAHRDIAVLNTGAALVVAGIAADIEGGRRGRARGDRRRQSRGGAGGAGRDQHEGQSVGDRGRGFLMAPVLQCPDCSTKHPARRRVERERVPVRGLRPCPQGARAVPARDHAGRAPPRDRPVPTARRSLRRDGRRGRKRVWCRFGLGLGLWFVAVPLGFVLVFGFARAFGLLSSQQLQDVFLEEGWDRFWPVARLLPFVALVTASIVHFSVLYISRWRVRHATRQHSDPEGRPNRPRRRARATTRSSSISSRRGGRARSSAGSGRLSPGSTMRPCSSSMRPSGVSNASRGGCRTSSTTARNACARTSGGAAGAGPLGGARAERKGPSASSSPARRVWTTVRRGMRRYAYRRHERVWWLKRGSSRRIARSARTFASIGPPHTRWSIRATSRSN